jgi:hypothetical protein
MVGSPKILNADVLRMPIGSKFLLCAKVSAGRGMVGVISKSTLENTFVISRRSRLGLVKRLSSGRRLDIGGESNDPVASKRLVPIRRLGDPFGVVGVRFGSQDWCHRRGRGKLRLDHAIGNLPQLANNLLHSLGDFRNQLFSSGVVDDGGPIRRTGSAIIHIPLM